jgi:two-component system nitrogen regulation response regulator GlnG
LFHRLNVIRLRLPALRERREDIPMLTRHFLGQSAKQLGVEPKRIADTALQRLSAFDFPGNVRQLENVCHWLTVMAPAQVIEEKDLPPEVLANRAGADGLHALQAPLSAANRPLDPQQTLAAGPAASVLSSTEGPVGASTSSAPAASRLPAEPVPGASVSNLPVDGVHQLSNGGSADWLSGLQDEAQALLSKGRDDVWDVLTRKFESQLILTALANTRGRRIEAAQRLGIGRNTITRKIQELNLEG